MRKLPKELEEPFLRIVDSRSLSNYDRGDYLKWLRYYLDFCAKYGNPPRDCDSLPLFLQKLASKRQSTKQQQQAADSVSIYYDVIADWNSMCDAGKVIPVTRTPWDDCYKALKEEIALRHYSPKTLKTYRGWISQFQKWLGEKLPEDVDSADARGFLSHLAVEKNVAASTQNQAFNALLFLFRHILKREYDIGDNVPRARRTKYIPVVLSRKEVDMIIDKLRIPYRLIVELLYGCGLRMSECINLRVNDLNFDECIITVHRGKGGKDRTVPLPRVLIPELHKQLEVVEALLKEDLSDGFAGTFMPNALGRKLRSVAKDIGWQWLFPASMLTLIPKDNEYRRYHIHETKLQKALRSAVIRSDVKKRVTCHTFRHSFASHLLRANYDIRTIQQLLGHSDVKTTMIYTHTVRSRTMKEIESPLDFPVGVVETLEGFSGGILGESEKPLSK